MQHKIIFEKSKSVSVTAPATIANIVCGYDILGLCANAPADILHLKTIREKKVKINPTPFFDIPTEPSLNTAGAPLLEIMEELNLDFGFELNIEKNIKPGSGLGSSAASAAAAVVAANYLLDNIFTKEDLVRFAMSGEKVASGVKHADNVTPCIYGGITLIRSIFPLDIVKISCPDLHITIVHPQIEVKTADARQILRKEVKLKDAIKQWGNIAGLVAGLMQSDFDLISRSLEDVIIEPVRSILIPAFDEVKKMSKLAGAIGGGISGSGPSIFMLSQTREIAEKIASIMKEIYDNRNIPNYTYVTSINKSGVEIIHNS